VVVKERWEAIRVNYSRSITRAIKVRAKHLLITKEANLSVSLAHLSPSVSDPIRPIRFLFSTDNGSGNGVSAATAVVYSARSKFHSEFCFLNVCALRLYLSLPLAASRAPFPPPNSHPSRWSPKERARGGMEGREEGWISRASCP